MNYTSKVSIGLTTFPTQDTALKIAHELIQTKLAFCVQIDSPITSIYEWENTIHSSTEFRLVVKFLSANLQKIDSFIHKNHPYKVPQWLVVPASHVSTPYLEWAQKTSDLPTKSN